MTCGVLLAVHGAGTTLRLGAGPVGGATFHIAPLAAPFILLLGLVAAAIALYSPRYHEPGQGTAVYLAVYNLALLASLAVLVAGNVVAFLVAWESMALLCYLLILRHHKRAGVAQAAFLFIALSEIGFLMIVLAFAILATQTGTLDLAAIAARSSHVGHAGWRSAAYVLALCGFGFKAGLVPFHIWLPAAHPVAPADGSAFLSGLVIKLGVYGIALFGFVLVPRGPAWWGLVTMGFGAISAVLGILYALMERDLKRFLAYSSIENIGIIVTALGAGMTFTAYGQRAIGTFLLIVALYHTVNHGTYKTLLFLEAGVIEHATGTRDLDRLGGLIRRLPRTAVISLIGTVAIAALPPLNGFVSEWMLFQGLFQGFRISSHLVGNPDRHRRRADRAHRRAGDQRVRPRLRDPIPRHAAVGPGGPRHRVPPAGGGPGAARRRVRVPCSRRAIGADRARPRGALGHRTRHPVGVARAEADRDPGSHGLLRLLAHLPRVGPARAHCGPDPDLPRGPAPGPQSAPAGLGWRDPRLQGAHAVHRDRGCQSGTGDVRAAVPAKRSRRARLG